MFELFYSDLMIDVCKKKVSAFTKSFIQRSYELNSRGKRWTILTGDVPAGGALRWLGIGR